MGKKDTVTKMFMMRLEIFADAFNYKMFGGEQRIRSEDLHPLDTAMAGAPYGADGAVIPAQKQRDVLKYLAAMEGNTAIYMALGIENQSEVQYAMPVRAMLYDALYYASQVEEAARSHRREASGRQKQLLEETGKDGKAADTQRGKKNSGEYLSGFYRSDHLLSVITLVVSFTADDWDAPLSLHEMFLPAVQKAEILSLVPDYRIHLLSPAQMQIQEFERLKSDLREVLEFIKYSKDKERLQEVVMGNTRFEQMEPDTVRVINIVTGSKIRVGKKGEKVNVCKAWEDMIEEGREEGREVGRKEGRREGRIEGGIETLILDNQEDGTPIERIIEKLQKRFSLTYEQAMQYIKKVSAT